MAQHDYVIANGTGAAVRSDLNNALAAIVSQNSGATAPATTYAFQFWADTTTGLLKLRNSANSAWVTLFQLDGEWSTLPVENGTAAAPSIYFKDSGTDTGFYSPGTDQIGISTGGTARLTIDANGNLAVDTNTLYVDAPNNRVGIGSSSPQCQLTNTGNSSLGTNSWPTTDVGNSAGRVLIGNEGQLMLWNETVGAGNTAGIMLGAKTGAGANTLGYSAVRGGTENASNRASFMRLETCNSVGTPSTAIHVDSSQRVGIGTTSPQNLFVISNGGANGLEFNTTSESGTANYVLSYNRTAAAYRDLRFDTAATRFEIGGNEAVRIDSSRRLLVGTNSVYADSSELFEVYKANGPNNGWVSTPNLANDDSVSWRALGGVSSATLRQSGIGVYKHSGIATPCGFLYMQAQNADTLYYWTDNSSNFRISTLASNIGTTGGTVVGTQTSDERIKNILGPVEYGLDEIKQIEPVRYSLKAEPDVEKLGFIAQQVQPLIPQSIFDTNEHIEGEPEDAPTKLGMEYVSLIPVLVNAIKELSAEVDALKTQLQAQ